MTRASRGRAAALLLPVWLVLASARAHAMDGAPTPADVALAETLFREGRRLFEAGAFGEACPQFATSQRLDPAGGTLLNLARCHEAEGKLTTAWAEYHEARVWARREGREDRVRAAEVRIAALEPRLTWLVVRIPSEADVAGLEVWIDDRRLPRSAFGVPTPVDPGQHRILVTAPGRERRELDLRADREGEAVTVELPRLAELPRPDAADALRLGQDAADAPLSEARASERTPATTPAPTSPGAAASTGDRWAPTPTLIGAGGLVSLIVGAAFGVHAVERMAASDEACPQGACTERGAELSRQANRSANVANVGIGLGAVGLGVGLALHLTRHRVPRGPRAAGALTLTTTIDRGGPRLGLGGRF